MSKVFILYSQKYKYRIIYNYKYTYSAGMKERCRDGCRTSLLIAGVVLVPAIFHTSLPPCHPYITIHFMEMIFSTFINTVWMKGCLSVVMLVSFVFTTSILDTIGHSAYLHHWCTVPHRQSLSYYYHGQPQFQYHNDRYQLVP